MSMLLAGTLAVAGLTGCDNGKAPSYSHFEEIPSTGWDPLDVLTFEPMPHDSTESRHTNYDLSLVIRHASRHRIASMPIAVTIEDDNGTVSTDTIIIDTESHDSHTHITTRYGITELHIPICSNVTLTEGYNISLESFREKSSTIGLLNIGLIMEPASSEH